jgi:hypothetical protein
VSYWLELSMSKLFKQAWRQNWAEFDGTEFGIDTLNPSFDELTVYILHQGEIFKMRLEVFGQ